ncbi:MAG: hypothetical protein AMXMBFR84_35470 [Candidatus Hydrogenedentota bacterium]
MTRVTFMLGFLAVLFCPVVCVVASADWPQFLGPNRDGVSDEQGLSRTWPDSGPRVLWSVPVGAGYGAPAIHGGEVFLLDRKDDQVDILRCLSLASGEELWSHSYDAPGTVGHTGSRTPPTVDEKYVYSVGMMGDFLCTDRGTHKPVWKKNLVTDFQSELPRWGVSQSPLLYKNLVIVAAQAPDAFVVAYDRATGELTWKSPGLGLSGYVSPVLATLGGTEQLVVVSASNRPGTEKGATAGLSLEDGSVLWTYDGWQCFIPIPHPTLLPDDKLFITGGYKAGSVIIQVKKGATGFEVSEVAKLAPEVCGSQIHQPILYNGHLYVNSNSNEQLDGMACIALDGTVKWKTSQTEGLPLFERGALMMADDMIFAIDGKEGSLHLIEPKPDGYKELAKVAMLQGHELWAPMALTDGKLLVRSQDILKCLDVKNP